VKKTIRILLFVIFLCFATVWESLSAGRPAGSCCSIALPSISLYAQEAVKPAGALSPETDRPADTSSVLYQVTGVILIIWLGLAFFLYRIDRRVARLEKSMPVKSGKDS
jgi:CcmD family protein